MKMTQYIDIVGLVVLVIFVVAVSIKMWKVKS